LTVHRKLNQSGMGALHHTGTGTLVLIKLNIAHAPLVCIWSKAQPNFQQKW